MRIPDTQIPPREPMPPPSLGSKGELVAREHVPLQPIGATTETASADHNGSAQDNPSGFARYRELFEGFEVRNLTPREMVELSQTLYATGVLSFDEHALLAYQPELQPEYNRTIGALTGETADPDRKRDFLGDWEDRLTFELKYNPIDSTSVYQTKRIVDVLRHLDHPPTDMVA